MSKTPFQTIVDYARTATPYGATNAYGEPIDMEAVVSAVLLGLREYSEGVVHVSAGHVRTMIDYLMAERTPAAEPMQDGDVIELFSQSDGIVNGVMVAGQRFVVIQAGWTRSAGPHSSNPEVGETWEVCARKLRDDGTYDPVAQVVHFVQKGQPNAHHFKTEAAGRVVGKMQKGYV